MTAAQGPSVAEQDVPSSRQRCDTFARNIREEPEALERALHAYAAPRGPLTARPLGSRLASSRVVLAGMGSSYNACLAGAWWMRRGGIAAFVEYASEIEADTLEGDWTLVIVSQSGSSPEVLRAMANFRESSRGLVVAVTNCESSPLAAGCDVLLPLLAGPEGDIAAKSYVNSVAVLTLLAGQMLGSPQGLRPSDLTAAIDAGAEVLAAWPRFEDSLRRSVAPGRSVVCLGSQAGRATAEEGAIILKEASMLPAEALVTAEFLHGALYMAGPRYTAVLTPADRGGWPDDQARQWLLRAGATVVEIGGAGPSSVRFPVPPLGPAARPLVEALPMELVAKSIWHSQIDQSSNDDDTRRDTRIDPEDEAPGE